MTRSNELVPLSGYSPETIPNKVILYNGYHPSEMELDNNRMVLELIYEGQDKENPKIHIYSSPKGAMDGGIYNSTTFNSAIFVCNGDYWGLINISIDCSYIISNGGSILMRLNKSGDGGIDFVAINEINSDFSEHELKSRKLLEHSNVSSDNGVSINYKNKSINANQLISEIDSKGILYSNRMSDMIVKGIAGPIHKKLTVNNKKDGENIFGSDLAIRYIPSTKSCARFIDTKEGVEKKFNNYCIEEDGEEYYLYPTLNKELRYAININEIDLIPNYDGNAIITKDGKPISNNVFIDDSFGNGNYLQQVFGSVYLKNYELYAYGNKILENEWRSLKINEDSYFPGRFASVGYNAFIDIATGALYEIKHSKDKELYKLISTRGVLEENKLKTKTKISEIGFNIFAGLSDSGIKNNGTVGLCFSGYYGDCYYVSNYETPGSTVYKIILK